MGYTKHTIKGISWMSAGRFVTRALAFLKIFILARILTPSQFGIFGIASLMLAFLETLTETGVNIILIQSKDEVSEYINSAWVVSIIRGMVIALFILLTAPFIATFFHTPEAVGILQFISMVPFARGFINPAEVKFQKELKFNLQFLLNSTLYLTDAIAAIIISLMTHSVYALVWSMLISALLEIIISFAFIRPLPSFVIERKYIKEISHRGIWITVYTTFNYFAENIDNAVVGRVMGAESLGLYQMAYKIAIIPITEISEVVSSVVFPVFTRISDDIPRLTNAFFKSLSIVILGAVFAGLIVFFFPQQIILILLGNKWLSIVPVLQVLIIYGVLRTIGGPASALLLSLKKQKDISITVFIRLFTLVISIYPLVRFYGLVGAGYAQVASVIVEVPIVLYFAFRAMRKRS